MSKTDLRLIPLPAIPNRFGVIPTPQRLQAHRGYTGKGVTIALIDSGFYAHPDLTGYGAPKPWDWHGTQTSVVAAGNSLSSDEVGTSCSSFGVTPDGIVKPEVMAEAIWIAAPLVTSVVAQMLEANPELTPRAVKHLLMASALRISEAPLLWQGFGMVRAGRAVELAEPFDASLPETYLKPPRISGSRLVFHYVAPGREKVSLLGDFNGWNPEADPMQNAAEGVWKVEIPIPPPGRYRYKFLADGEIWAEDPANGLKEDDGQGGFNSILNLK